MTNKADRDTRLVRFADVRKLAIDMGLEQARNYESESVLQAANQQTMHGYRYAERILELFRERLGDMVEVIADEDEVAADQTELVHLRELIDATAEGTTEVSELTNEQPTSGEEEAQESTEETTEEQPEGQTPVSDGDNDGEASSDSDDEKPTDESGVDASQFPSE